RAARRVDVERDVLLRILRLEVQQLRHDEVRDLIVDRRAEEDDPLVEQAAVDLELALAARGALDDHGDEGHGRKARTFTARARLRPRTRPHAGLTARARPAQARRS